MIAISILDFLRTGNFGPVKIGMLRDEIIAKLGLPDWYYPDGQNHMSASLWSYGGVQLSFYDALHKIYFKPQYFNEPDTTNIRVNPWIFERGYEPTKQELTVALQEEGIEVKDTGVLLLITYYIKKTGKLKFIRTESEIQTGDQFHEEVGFLSLKSGVEVLYEGNKVNPVYGADGTNKVIQLGIAIGGSFTIENQPLQDLRSSW